MFKNNRSEIRIITDIDMLLMVEKGIRGRIFHAIHRYTKTNDKYMKNLKIIIKHHIIIPHVFRCKQFVCIGNVLKTSCKWFRIGRRSI